ncbi:MAG: hypothetical protein VKJ06_08075, partial [Vampirovibrionales bacterium]|nr:hypothetical protein [Vampirovibrionales bacterium]
MAKPKTSKVSVAVYANSVEAAVFSDAEFAIKESLRLPTSVRLFSDDGSLLLEPDALTSALTGIATALKLKNKPVHLSVPPVLIKQAVVPRVDPKMLRPTLLSETERYKSFEDIEAAIGYSLLPSANAQQIRLVMAALRQDTLKQIAAACTKAGIKIASVDVWPADALRAMAGTGVLDSLMSQLGEEGYWGAMFIEAEQIRFGIWQGNTLIEFRDSVMGLSGAETGGLSPIQIEDITQELIRMSTQTPARFWFVAGTTETSIEQLSQRSGLPMKACFWLPSFPVEPAFDGELPRITTVGAAMRNFVPFPFDLQLMQLNPSLFKPASVLSTMLAARSAKAPSVADDMPEMPDSSIPVLATSLLGAMIVMGLLAAGGKAGELYINQQKATVESQLEAGKTEMVTVQGQLNEAKASYQVQQSVADLIDQAKQRNRVYTLLGTDLRTKVPSQLWLSETRVTDKITFQGKALRHQDVIRFARSLD